MLRKTRGIIINYVKFKETSIITKIYTEDFGIQTYIENGVRSSRGKNKIALFQPLTVLDLVVYHDEKKEINRLSEIKCNQPFKTIPYEIKKSSIAIFINEVLLKSLKEHTANKILFDFLQNAIFYLDNKSEDYENFHLYFMISFSSYLGFAPENAEQIISQLLNQAIKVENEKQINALINKLIENSFGAKISISRIERNQILEVLLIYFKLHIDGFGDVKSTLILKEILN